MIVVFFQTENVSHIVRNVYMFTFAGQVYYLKKWLCIIRVFLTVRETYERQKVDVKTKAKELQNMEESLTQKVGCFNIIRVSVLLVYAIR